MRTLKDAFFKKARPRFATEAQADRRAIPVPPFTPAGVTYVPSWGMNQNMSAAGEVVLVENNGQAQYAVVFYPQTVQKGGS